MKILIVKTSSLGDIIHAFPVIDFIIQHVPNAVIDWVVEKPFAELVEAHPKIRNTLIVQTKKWRSALFKVEHWKELIEFRKCLKKEAYDLILDLQGNIKSGLVTLAAKSVCKVGFGKASVPEWPNLFTTHKRFNPPLGKNVREDYLFLAQQALKDFSTLSLQQEKYVLALRLNETQKTQFHSVKKRLGEIYGKKKVIVCPGSNWSNKQLTLETLNEFLLLFSKKEDVHFLCMWGNQAEKEIGEYIASSHPGNSTVMDKLSLPVLQNVMTEVDLIFAMDSLPLHLAGMTSTLTYSFFGPSSAKKYMPIGPTQNAYQGSCPYGRHFEKRCPILRTCTSGACIKELKAEDLFQHFYSWWKMA